jgi:hypothetical protein
MNSKMPEAKPEKRMISTEQAADKLKTTKWSIAYYCRNHNIGQKVGREHLLSEDEVEQIKLMREKRWNGRVGKVVETPNIEPWVHLKTGKYYYRILPDVINTTNDQDGQEMIVYEDDNKKRFAREKNEFYEKFSPVK